MLLYIYIKTMQKINNKKRERESRLTLNNIMKNKKEKKKNRNDVIIEGKIVN